MMEPCGEQSEHSGHHYIASDFNGYWCPGAVTLAEFLLARIAEEEAKVRKALEPQWDGTPTFYSTFNAQRDDWGLWLFNVPPTRLLAECEAKRRIVNRYERLLAGQQLGLRYLYQSLQDLALTYADHPDYQQEWAL